MGYDNVQEESGKYKTAARIATFTDKLIQSLMIVQ